MRVQAKDLMTRNLITIGLEEPIWKAYSLMRSKKIRHLPVLDQGGKIMGILSDRDVKRAMIPTMQPSSPASMETGPVEFPSGARAKEFMSWPVQTIDEELNPEEIAAACLKEKVSAFIIVDRQGRPCGIVTTDDLLRFLIELCRDGRLLAPQEKTEFWSAMRFAF